MKGAGWCGSACDGNRDRGRERKEEREKNELKWDVCEEMKR